MSFEDFEEDLKELLTLFREGPPPWARRLEEHQHWVEQALYYLGETMANLVTIDQDELTRLATLFEQQSTALVSAAGEVSGSANGLTVAAQTLATYVQQLIAGQAQPLAAADETAINAALADVEGGVTTLNEGIAALGTASDAVTALEPITPVVPVTPVSPTPTPVSPSPVTPTPVSPTPVSPSPVTPTPVSPAPVSPPPVNPTPVSPSPVSPTPVSPAPAPVVAPVPADPNASPVQAGTLDPATVVVEVPQGVVPVSVPAGAVSVKAGVLPADAWVTPVSS